MSLQLNQILAHRTVIIAVLPTVRVSYIFRRRIWNVAPRQSEWEGEVWGGPACTLLHQGLGFGVLPKGSYVMSTVVRVVYYTPLQQAQKEPSGNPEGVVFHKRASVAALGGGWASGKDAT